MVQQRSGDGGDEGRGRQLEAELSHLRAILERLDELAVPKAAAYVDMAITAIDEALEKG